jgi:hypothetical protein
MTSQPGVIPLRPLGVNDILGGAIATMRAHPRPMFGVTAVFVIIGQLLTTVATYPWLDELYRAPAITEDTPPSEVYGLLRASLAVFGITLAITLPIRVLLSGFLALVVGKAVLGQPTTIGEVLRLVRPRLPALLGLTLIYPAVVLGVAAVLVGLALAAPPLAIFVGLGLIPVGIWLYIVFSLATPALMLEHAPIRRAFGRSRHLVRGTWWRLFGIELLIAVLALVAGLIITTLFTSFAAGADQLTSSYLALSTIGSIVAGILTEPFAAAAIVLLYTDQRIRREGMDTELARYQV